MLNSLAGGLLSVMIAMQVSPTSTPESEGAVSAVNDVSNANDNAGPKRPRLGTPPSADRISSVNVITNSDGTMRRETQVAGKRVEHLSDPIPPKQELPSDPSYRPPDRAKVGSIHDSETPSNAGSTTGDGEKRKGDSGFLFPTIVGAIVAVVIVVALSRNSKPTKQ